MNAFLKTLKFTFQDVTIMAHSLEKFFLLKKNQMPPVEFEMTPEQLRRPNTKKNPAVRGKRVLPPGAASSELLNNDKKPDLGSATVKHSSIPSQSVAGDRNYRLQ